MDFNVATGIFHPFATMWSMLNWPSGYCACECLIHVLITNKIAVVILWCMNVHLVTALNAPRITALIRATNASVNTTSLSKLSIWPLIIVPSRWLITLKNKYSGQKHSFIQTNHFCKKNYHTSPLCSWRSCLYCNKY